MKMTSSLFFFAGFLVLLQVVFSIPPPTSNIQEGDVPQGITLQSLLTDILTEANVQQEDPYDGGDSDEGEIQSDYDSDERIEEQDAMTNDYGLDGAKLQQNDGDEGDGSDELAIMERVSEQIRCGDTVSFKTSLPTKWMTFWKSKVPFTSECPNLFMDGGDFSRCPGTVFNIYRLRTSPTRGAKGPIKVGEKVGLYYRRGGVWLGCAGGNGAKCYRATCPGKPTSAYGFAGPKLITRCYGAVFKIFARGKKVGDLLTHQDDILLYINSGGQYVSYEPQSMQMYGTTFEAMVMHRDVCSGRMDSKYEKCPNEMFSIWKKGVN